MKYVFLSIFIALCCFSGISVLTRQHDDTSGPPTLYWMTDINPTRAEQVNAFQNWMTANGHPPVQLKVDESVAGVTGSGAGSGPDAKIVIQGVSGVLTDLVDLPAQDLNFIQDIGLFDDLTADAERMGFGLDKTYPAATTLIEADGHQYLFPANVAANLLVINKATFARFHQPVPPRRWSLDEFESMGKAFVAAANPPGVPVDSAGRVFFADRLEPEDVRRSLGLSVFNETLTACTLDDPRAVRVMKLLRHWSDDLRLLPTQADVASFATGGGYGGIGPQLLRSGQCGMILYSVNLFIQLRQFDQPLDLAATESPNGGFPCMLTRVRGVGIYRASKHRDLARYFLSFLASREYNQNVVDDCDALPPNPAFLRDPRFLKPVGHANEWDARRAFAEESTTIAAPVVVSPFVHYHNAIEIETRALESYLSDISSAEQSLSRATRQMNAAIHQTVADEPSMRAKYAELVSRQSKIDALKQDGKPIPIDWIENPFYRQYYAPTHVSIRPPLGGDAPQLARGRAESKPAPIAPEIRARPGANGARSS